MSMLRTHKITKDKDKFKSKKKMSHGILNNKFWIQL